MDFLPIVYFQLLFCWLPSISYFDVFIRLLASASSSTETKLQGSKQMSV